MFRSPGRMLAQGRIATQDATARNGEQAGVMEGITGTERQH